MHEIQPISGACVWHGRKMAASSSRWRRRLSDAQLAEIERAVRQASARGLGWQTITADDFPLPSCAAGLSGADRDDVMALDRSLLPHRCGEDGIGGFADDPLLLCLGIKFAMDSLLEGTGFEPSVPQRAPDIVSVSVLVRRLFRGEGRHADRASAA